MEFFQYFSDAYNQVHRNRQFSKLIPPSDEEWNQFEKKLDIMTEKKREYFYMTILHYYFLTTKKLDDYPYGIKRKGKDLIVNYQNLPYLLQHILISFL